MSDEHDEQVKPSEQRGGTTPGDEEARAKGPWAAKAAEGVVPPELGGSDAPEEMLGEDPAAMRSAVLGETTGSDEPATEAGVNPHGGDHADATTDGGPDPSTGAGEPDLRDAAGGPRQVDVDSAET
jgi:hypothetical protein